MMKKIFLGFLVCICLQSVFAQVPQQFNYQAVARNTGGAPVANQAVKLRLSIHAETPNGGIRYAETRTVITNAFGLFTITIGSDGALAVTGSLGTIDWDSDDHFLQTEIDVNNGNSFINMGTTRLLSVPYALQAQKAVTADLLQLPFSASVNTGSPLIDIKNTGTGSAMKLEIETNAGPANVLEVKSNVAGTGVGIYVSKGSYGTTIFPGAVTAETSTLHPGVAGYSKNGYGIFGSSTNSDGIYGISYTGQRAGVKGTTTDPGGIGIFGLVASGTGVSGVASSGTGGHFSSNVKALHTDGPLQIDNTGASKGQVLMTDANGDAHWEGGTAFSASSINNALTIPHAINITVPFYTVDYNIGTDYRTIASLIDPNTFIAPVTGIYHFDAALLWEAFSSTSGSAFTNLLVNGTVRFSGRQASANGRQTTLVSGDLLLNAGDKVIITAYQTSGATQTMPNILGSYFTGRFVMKN